MNHHYNITTTWTGNLGTGSSEYTAYSRNHTIQALGKPLLECSADAPFRGEAHKYNPEDMLLASLSTCHMLWYLHLCADAGIVVESYTDAAVATLSINDGKGKMTSATLNPIVHISKGDALLAAQLHSKAHEHCFIANSVNFAVACNPSIFEKDA